MLKTMKNKKALKFIIFLLCLNNTLPLATAKKTDFLHVNNSANNSKEQLYLEKKLFFYKLILTPTLICGMFLYNQQKLLENIKKNPLIMLIGSCIISNFYIDAAIKYKEINKAIELFRLSKKISRHLLYAIAIKNTMLKIASNDTCCDFKEEDFLKIITKEIPLSFPDLELFIFELLHNCIKTIQTLHIKINTDIEEQIYLLCKEHITLEDILNFYSNDKKLYPLLQKLQENPSQYYKNVAIELNTLIKKQFQYMIKHQSNNF